VSGLIEALMIEYPEKPSKVTDMIESHKAFTSGSSKFEKKFEE
jgi:hypothetical protein